MWQRRLEEPTGLKEPFRQESPKDGEGNRGMDLEADLRFIFEREQREQIRRIAASSLPVLIRGETGAGKEIVARYIHRCSPRRDGPFIKLHCAAIPEGLVESELFGYRKGAFTGALQDKPGRFQQADGGTLLLDEVAEIGPSVQTKLLQVLQDQEFDPLGGKSSVSVDVRIIAATHRDLPEWISKGLFREDLYYRLNIISLNVPALRERKDQILPLARHLLERYGASELWEEMPCDLREAMVGYNWPGNVRELENTLRRLTVFRNYVTVLADIRGARHEFAGRQQQPPEPNQLQEPSWRAAESSWAAGPRIRDVEQAAESCEKQLIVDALTATHWNRRKAAKLLDVDYRALLYKIRRLQVDDTRLH